MKVKRKPLNITDVFEIRLLQDDWQRILRISARYQISCSWAVRLCLFKYMRVSLAPAQKEILETKYRYSGKKDLHRHMLCLYGCDALAIRYFAATHGITITMLVRLALAEFLPGVDSGWLTPVDLTEAGIKIRCQSILTNVESGVSSGMETPCFLAVRWFREKNSG